MKKLVFLSVAAGVVYAILSVICELISRVADYRLISFLFGFTIFVFWDVLANRVVGTNHTKLNVKLFLLLVVIISSVAFVITALLKSVRAWKIEGFDPSFGWMMLGCISLVITQSFIASLRKLRKIRLAEKQRKARLAELMNK